MCAAAKGPRQQQAVEEEDELAVMPVIKSFRCMLPRPLPSLPSSAQNLLSLVRGERLRLLRLHGNFAAAFV